MEPIHKRLKRYREKNRLTIRQLSEMTHIPMSTYREWEYGRSITGEPYVKLAIAFKISLHELLTGEPHRNSILDYIEEIEKILEKLKENVKSFS